MLVKKYRRKLLLKTPVKSRYRKVTVSKCSSKIPYQSAAQKKYGIEMLFKKTLQKCFAKHREKIAIEKVLYRNARQKMPYNSVAQNTVKKSLSKQNRMKMLQQSILQKCCTKHRQKSLSKRDLIELLKCSSAISAEIILKVLYFGSCIKPHQNFPAIHTTHSSRAGIRAPRLK